MIRQNFTIAIASTALVILTSCLTAQANSDQPICYIQTPNGKVSDLSQLCGNASLPVNAKTISDNPSVDYPDAFVAGSSSSSLEDTVKGNSLESLGTNRHPPQDLNRGGGSSSSD
jgi:hypothetical protein